MKSKTRLSAGALLTLMQKVTRFVSSGLPHPLAVALGALLVLAFVSAVRAQQPAVEKTRAVAIEEGSFADIDSVEQWITIRGRDRRNPILLYLHRGPGLPNSRRSSRRAAAAIRLP